VCEVSYTTPTQTQLSFRKFFKFQVLKPLDVKTKFYNAEVILKSWRFNAWLVVFFCAVGTLNMLVMQRYFSTGFLLVNM
jgi:hypothetical protein